MKNGTSFRVGFALGHPQEHLSLTRREPERDQWGGIREVWGSSLSTSPQPCSNGSNEVANFDWLG